MSQKKLFSRPLYILTIIMVFVLALPILITPQQAWGQANLANMDLDMNQLLQDPVFKAQFDKLSPAEQKNAVQEIDTMMNQLSNMTPEDWEKVNQMATAMESELEKRGGFDNMSDDDFNQFFNDFATDWEAKEKTESKPATPEKKKEEKPKKVDVKTVSEKEQLLNNINAIIKSIDSFVAKANTIPELAGNVQDWGKSGILSAWPAGSTWNSIKKAVQSLHQKLEFSITTDKKTADKRYLDYIFEDQALVKAITDLKNSLTIQEPLIDVHAFGLEPLSKQSKEATKKVLNSLGAAINAGALETAIDKAVAKHEPVAQKSREQEEKARKAAEQELQRKPGMKPAIQTSAAAGGYSDYGSSYSGSDYGDYYGGGDYSSYTPSYSRSSRSSGTSGRESGARGQRASGPAGTRGGKEAKNAEKPEKNKKKEEPKKVIPEPANAQDKNINTLMARFEENIDRAVELIEDESILEMLEKNKDKASKPASAAGKSAKTDKDIKVENTLSEDIEADLAHFITTAASSINELYYNVTDTAFYKKHIDSVIKKPKAALDPVIKALNAQYEKAEKEYDAHVAKLEDQKSKLEEQNNALVMPEGAGKEAEKQKALITQQQSLIDLQIKALEKPTVSGVVKAYNMLNKAISRFEKTKEKPGAAKKK